MTARPTTQEMHPPQLAHNRTTKEAISNVSQAGQSADRRTTNTGNAPLKKNLSDDSLGHSEPRTTKTPQSEATYSEKQGKEATLQVTNTRAGNWRGNAEQTDPDEIIKIEPKNQESLVAKQPTDIPPN